MPLARIGITPSPEFYIVLKVRHELIALFDALVLIGKSLWHRKEDKDWQYRDDPEYQKTMYCKKYCVSEITVSSICRWLG